MGCKTLLPAYACFSMLASAFEGRLRRQDTFGEMLRGGGLGVTNAGTAQCRAAPRTGRRASCPQDSLRGTGGRSAPSDSRERTCTDSSAREGTAARNLKKYASP